MHIDLNSDLYKKLVDEANSLDLSAKTLITKILRKHYYGSHQGDDNWTKITLDATPKYQNFES